MDLAPPFRPAAKADCRRIAELFALASGGVSLVVWQMFADEYPGLTPLDIGERRYAREATNFSYQNCVLAEVDGRVVGMLVTFPIPEDDDAGGSDDETPEVLRPYAELEVPGSWYVCGIAVDPDHQDRGLGTAFLEIARAQARERGLSTLSLIVFEQNTGATRLYDRLGYREVDRRPVVPHPDIEYTGEAILMTAEV